jgi:hypothetical protein
MPVRISARAVVVEAVTVTASRTDNASAAAQWRHTCSHAGQTRS